MNIMEQDSVQKDQEQEGNDWEDEFEKSLEKD